MIMVKYLFNSRLLKSYKHTYKSVLMYRYSYSQEKFAPLEDNNKSIKCLFTYK